MSTFDQNRMSTVRILTLTFLLLGSCLPSLQMANALTADSFVEAPSMPKIAFLYNSVWGGNEIAYESVLEPFGFDLVLVNYSQILNTNLDTFDLLIIDRVVNGLNIEEVYKIGNASVNAVVLGGSMKYLTGNLGGPDASHYIALIGGSQELIFDTESDPMVNNPNILPGEINVTSAATMGNYLKTTYNGTDVEFLAHNSNSQYYGLFKWTAPSGQQLTGFTFSDNPTTDFTQNGIKLLENIIVNSLPDSELETPGIREIAFVYTAESTGLDFQAFFESHNNSVDLIYKPHAAEWNFNKYDLIVIGPGNDFDWTGYTSNIIGSGKPILTVGREGLYFIDEIGGPGRLSTATAYNKYIYANETTHPIFNSPYSLPTNITYSTEDFTQMEGIYAPNLPYGRLLAKFTPTSSHFPIYEWGKDGQQFLMFGMNATGAELTDHGKQLYINALEYMAPKFDLDCPDLEDGDAESIIDQILDTITDPANLPGIGTASGLAMLIGLLIGIIGSKGKKGGKKK